ncbi:GGDEF domain-containing protein [Falsibacillus albus]|uniref:GGDEF domain-containing protein n=1 Tax=Falsibacillus albus TaxID=2478915 RepID=A0A3L7JX01_9BACI|nr:hypothetical protein [Falsibacillus albus]RLQ94855.1 hypothetical protein D9X91_12775 [Falsibacillus albus]
MLNQIQIGIIGPEYLYEKINHSLKMFPNFQPTYRLSNHLFDAPLFTKELSEKVDVLLYSGWSPYSLSKKEIPPHIPAHFIPLKGSGFYRTLYGLKKIQPDIKGISIDILPAQDVKRALRELDEDISVSYYEGSNDLEKIQDMIDFHKKSFALQTNAAITGLKVVADELTKLEIPNQWVVPTEEDIIVTLERALLSTEKRRNRESQIVFGLIQFDGYYELVHQMASEHLIQRQNLRLNRLILDYVEQLEGHLTSLSGNEFMFITTRGVFERVTQGYKWIPLIAEAKKQLKLNISMGVGFGLSANEAGTHARHALMQAMDFGGECCFIVKEDRSVFGPVEQSAPMIYPLHITDESLLKKAEQAGMSATYQQKLLSLIRRKRDSQFTAHELAETLGITARSAHRIILKWLDANLISIIGMEKISTRGRPRQVYELIDKTLLTNLSGGK